MNSHKSPKNKYRVEMNYGKPLDGIGSATSITTNSTDENQPHIQHHIDQAKRNNTTLDVRWLENKKTYPEFEWEEIKKYQVK